MTERQYCTFHVGGLLFGVEVNLVHEVLTDVRATPVPLADPCVDGVINLRGQIVTSIDARRRLGLAPRGDGERATNVVIRATHEAVSLMVDTEGDVVGISEDGIAPLPENVNATIREFVTGACQVEGGLLLLLDAPRLLAVERTAQ
jgi:purine-binding chemotaxis protein CheW